LSTSRRMRPDSPAWRVEDSRKHAGSARRPSGRHERGQAAQRADIAAAVARGGGLGEVWRSAVPRWAVPAATLGPVSLIVLAPCIRRRVSLYARLPFGRPQRRPSILAAPLRQAPAR
jgi:hypothetical protein